MNPRAIVNQAFDRPKIAWTDPAMRLQVDQLFLLSLVVSQKRMERVANIQAAAMQF